MSESPSSDPQSPPVLPEQSSVVSSSESGYSSHPSSSSSSSSDSSSIASYGSAPVWEVTLPPEDNSPPPFPPDDSDDPRSDPPEFPDFDSDLYDELFPASERHGSDAFSEDMEGTSSMRSGSGSAYSSSGSEGGLGSSGSDSDGASEASGGSLSKDDSQLNGGNPSAAAAAWTKRKNIAREILSTEETYVKQLCCMVKLFCEPEGQKASGLSADEVRSLFSNVRVLRDLHSGFLENLKPKVEKEGPSVCLGAIFLDAGKWIKLYKHYVNNYDSAAELMTTLRNKNRTFGNYLKGIEFTPQMVGLNIEGLLVTPVQRVPRYVLLLQDLLKNTPEYHEDHEQIGAALKLIKEVADYINEHKRISDILRTLTSTKNRLTPLPFELAIPNRELLREGALLVNKNVDTYLHSLICSSLLQTEHTEDVTNTNHMQC